MHIDFHASPEPTLGVEWELALVDKGSRDLVNGAADLFAAAGPRLSEPEKVHRELLRNTVEVVTGVCRDVGEAVGDLRGTLAELLPVADGLGLDLYGGGTHPFASWTHQELTEGHRYAELINRTQWWGRQMLIWGVHVHVGLPERDRVLPVLSALLTYYPHLQALSASSPIWAGTDTGYASNRALMFQQLPTAGLPFQFRRWEEFEAYADDQLVTGVIDDPQRDPLGPAPGAAPGHPGEPGLRRDQPRRRPLRPGRVDALPGGRPRPARRGRRGAARAAALARAGEQVARGPLRPGRDRHRRRPLLRAARHRRPRRRAGAAGADRGAPRLRGRAAPRWATSSPGAPPTSASEPSPSARTGTWWPWSTPSCGSSRAGLDLTGQAGSVRPGGVISRRTPSRRTAPAPVGLVEPVQQRDRRVGQRVRVEGAARAA